MQNATPTTTEVLSLNPLPGDCGLRHSWNPCLKLPRSNPSNRLQQCLSCCSPQTQKLSSSSPPPSISGGEGTHHPGGPRHVAALRVQFSASRAGTTASAPCSPPEPMQPPPPHPIQPLLTLPPAGRPSECQSFPSVAATVAPSPPTGAAPGLVQHQRPVPRARRLQE